MITVEGLVKTYGGSNGSMSPTVKAVDNVSFVVEEGQFYTLLGPSGCGKTTTLRCIAGLERANGGRIEVGEVEVVSPTTFIPANQREIGMVFQSYAVWPHMTVFDNVAFPLRYGRHRMRNKAKIREKVSRVLELVGLEEATGRSATQMSGGQQQRLALARAVVEEPRVLLLDEPLSNLDARLRERMRSEIRLLQRRLGITTVFVTHDQAEALSMSDRIAVMSRGRIVQEGTPRDTYYSAESAFVANFIGSTNLIPGRIRPPIGDSGSQLVEIEIEIGTIRCDLAPWAIESNEVYVAIRPEEIRMAARGTFPDRTNVFPAELKVELFEGTHTDYFLEVGGCLELRARLLSSQQFNHPRELEAVLPPAACRVLNADEADAAAATATRDLIEETEA